MRAGAPRAIVQGDAPPVAQPLAEALVSATPFALGPTGEQPFLAVVALLAYVAAHAAFTVAVRRRAMECMGSCRFCHPVRWLLLPLPVVGAIAALTGIPHMWQAAERDLAEHGLPAPARTGYGYGIAYAVGRLLLLVPGAALLGLTLQVAGGIGFLAHLRQVADRLHTPEVAIA